MHATALVSHIDRRVRSVAAPEGAQTERTIGRLVNGDPMSTAARGDLQQRVLEEHTIDVIPASERHGTIRDQFTLWFGNCINVVNMPLGALAVILGLNILWAIIAIVVGTVLGTLFMSLHALQGPRLGVPQMIQSRAQFGFFGSGLFFIATFLLVFGFTAAELVLQAQALQVLAPGISVPLGALIFAVPMVGLAIYGYDIIHRYLRVATVVMGVTFVIITIQALTSGSVHGAAASTALPAFPLFLTAVALFATNTLTWAPYVSDYSRYLPEGTSSGKVVAAVSVGTIVPTVWTSALGAFLGALLPKAADIPAAIKQVSGSWALILMAISLIAACTTSAYTGMLSLVTLAPVRDALKRPVLARTIGVIIFAIFAYGAAALGYKSFLTNYSNFLYVLLFVFVPWTAVNLVDFYLVQHGKYDVKSLFTPRGIYGRWQWRGLSAYIVGLAAQIPFISQELYTGPLVKDLGGADISWIVGLIVGGGVYYLLLRIAPRTQIVDSPAHAAPAGPAHSVQDKSS